MAYKMGAFGPSAAAQKHAVASFENPLYDSPPDQSTANNTNPNTAPANSGGYMDISPTQDNSADGYMDVPQADEGLYSQESTYEMVDDSDEEDV